MALMGSMCIIEAEHAPFVYPEQVRKDKSEIVLNDFIFPIDPDLLAKDSYTAGASKSRFVIGFLAEISSSYHVSMICQVMLYAQHLIAVGPNTNMSAMGK